MATCQNHSTGTAECSGHRGVCAANRPISWGDAVQSGLIYADQVESLRNAIRAEITRWNTSKKVIDGGATVDLLEPDPIVAGAEIKNETYNNLATMLYKRNGATYDASTAATRKDSNYVKPAGSGPTVPGTDENPNNLVVIDNADWDALIAQYNIARTDCICNSDCSCNAICACYGDCGCNYSDRRLKENIQFLKTSHGINVYSWNYLWDQGTTHTGVMAQELLSSKFKHAVSIDANGFLMVDYSKLPASLKD